MHLRRTACRWSPIVAAFAVTLLADAPVFAQFNANDFVTYSQVLWGETPTSTNISGILQEDFNSVFASSNDLMQIGLPGGSGYSVIFDSAEAVINFLPSGGTPGPLTANLLDPVTTSSGALGGEVATLDLNIAFTDAGLIRGNLNIPFGNLVLTGLSGDLAFANGTTVRSLLGDADTVLGGGAMPSPNLTYLDLFTLLNDVDQSFNTGPVSSWADAHLTLPATTATAPEMDPSNAVGAAMLLGGLLAVLRQGRHGSGNRRRGKPRARFCST